MNGPGRPPSFPPPPTLNPAASAEGTAAGPRWARCSAAPARPPVPAAGLHGEAAAETRTLGPGTEDAEIAPSFLLFCSRYRPPGGRQQRERAALSHLT